MRELSVGHFSKARIWLNESPPIRCVGSLQNILTLPATQKLVLQTSAAIELFVPLGGRFRYGLLGGEFLSSLESKLELQIAVPSSSLVVYGDSLLSAALDGPLIGLPEEYVEAVTSGICSAGRRMGGLASGKLIITQGVYSDVGSSPITFKQLADVLACLLHASIEPTDVEIIGLINDAGQLQGES